MIRIVVGAAIIASLLASAVLSAVRLAHRVPAESLDAAARIVRDSFAEGDLVVSAPASISGPRQRLGDLPFVAPSRLRPEELRPYRRVHLLELDVIGADASLGDALVSLGRVEHEQRWSGVRLRRVHLARHDVKRFDARAELRRMKVSARYPDGAVASCSSFDRDRWMCPRDPQWNYVGRATVTIDDEPRACVWAHPVAAGGALVLELPAITPRPRLVTGGFGFTTYGARAAKAPVDVRLWAGEALVYEGRHPVTPEWRRFEVEHPQSDVPLRLELSTTNNGAAHFCFDLALVDPS